VFEFNNFNNVHSFKIGQNYALGSLAAPPHKHASKPLHRHAEITFVSAVQQTTVLNILHALAARGTERSSLPAP